MWVLLTMATIATIDDSQIGALIGQDLYRHQFGGDHMAFTGVDRKAAHSDQEALVQSCRDAELATEIVSHPELSLTVTSAKLSSYTQGLMAAMFAPMAMRRLHEAEQEPETVWPGRKSGDARLAGDLIRVHRAPLNDARTADKNGGRPAVVRLSIGMEDPRDILADLDQALATL